MVAPLLIAAGVSAAANALQQGRQSGYQPETIDTGANYLSNFLNMIGDVTKPKADGKYWTKQSIADAAFAEMQRITKQPQGAASPGLRIDEYNNRHNAANAINEAVAGLQAQIGERDKLGTPSELKTKAVEKAQALDQIRNYGLGNNTSYLMRKFGISADEINNAMAERGEPSIVDDNGNIVAVGYGNQQFPVENGMINTGKANVSLDAVQREGNAIIGDVIASSQAPAGKMPGGPGYLPEVLAKATTPEPVAAGLAAGTANVPQYSPQDLIAQIVGAVDQGRTAQETAIKQDWSTRYPQILDQINAALVKQGGGGRAALDTGGAISAQVEAKQQGETDVTKALADVAKYYSGLKQQALGQALSGSLNLAEMAQQAGQFNTSQNQQASQFGLTQDMQKWLAQQQQTQQNKELQAQMDQFAKSLNIQQQGIDWTKQNALLNRQYSNEDWTKNAELAKQLAGMQKTPSETSYWLNPLAQILGNYAGSASGSAAISKLFGG